MIINKCKNCGKDVTTFKSLNQQFCNKECYDKWRPGHRMNTGRTLFKIGESSPRKGTGKPYIHQGYRMIYVNGKKMFEHHYVWCSQPENLNYIPKGCVIHHKDGNKLNNDPDNLFLILKRDHDSFHSFLRNIIRYPKGSYLGKNLKLVERGIL